MSFACTTTDDRRFGCGSNTPSTGITLDLATVPEPSTLMLLILGSGVVLGFSVHARWRRAGI
ncbi:MAG: PEP-CTERM sorting domain-containing protein [Candidatus Rokubacteria bacterium]|nr:PEP-CTERM sorting domain-containing protein [Candidatus Rokubacteria bacterium]